MKILINYVIEVDEQPEFIHSLKHIDDKKNIDEIAQLGGYPLTKVLPDVVDAIECGVLKKVSV